MNIVILTPFFYPNINGMTLSCHRHAEMISSTNFGCTIDFLYIENSRLVSYNLADIPFNVKFKNESLRNWFKLLKGADVVILEGWSHPLLFVFSLFVRKKRILFSHGSHFPINFKFFSVIKFFLRQLIFFIPNILVFFGNVKFIILSDKPDFKRFRDVLFLKLFKRKFDVVPNFCFNDNINDNIDFNNKYLMVGTGDENKGQLVIVKHWHAIENWGDLDLYFPLKNDYTSEIESLIRNEGIKNVNVYYGANRQQIWNVLHKYNALIVNSITECQSLAVIDALVNKRKVITTRTGQYFNDYQSYFFYFDRGNLLSFLNAISSAKNCGELPIVKNAYSSKLYCQIFNFGSL